MRIDDMINNLKKKPVINNSIKRAGQREINKYTNPKNAPISKQRQWSNMSMPQKIIQRVIHYDTDRDSVPNKFDCRPRNPKRQEHYIKPLTQVMTEKEIEVPMYIGMEGIQPVSLLESTITPASPLNTPNPIAIQRRTKLQLEQEAKLEQQRREEERKRKIDERGWN